VAQCINGILVMLRTESSGQEPNLAFSEFNAEFGVKYHKICLIIFFAAPAASLELHT